MWELKKVHKVGELVAATAVVVSLLAVAYEIQQSNQAQLQANTRAVMGDWLEKLEPLMTAPGMACIYANGVTNYVDLNGEERLKLSAYFMSMTYSWEEMHYLASQEAIEQRIWRGVDTAIGEISHLPGFQQWFETRRHGFSEEFESYIDEWIARTPATQPVIYADESCARR